MPGQPREKEEKYATESGEVIMYQATSLDQESKAMYLAGYSDFALAFNDPEERLDKARDGMMGKVKGELLSETKIRLGKYPGREFVVRPAKSPQILARTRLFVLNPRVYQLVVVGDPAGVRGERANAFFNSFRLRRDE
jgi:hypothetical protein